MQLITHICRIAALVGLASLPLCAQQASGTVTVKGQVSGVAAVSVKAAARVVKGEAQVSAEGVEAQGLVLSLSGKRGGETEIEIPVQLRSNVKFALTASCVTKGTTLSALSVIEVGRGGPFVYPGAAERVEVPPTFDGRPSTRAPLGDRPELSSRATILIGPPISMRGGLDSPGNMIEVVLRLVLTAPDNENGWHAELKVWARPRVGAEQSTLSPESPALREKDVRKAEKVLEKLRLLGEAAAAQAGEADFRSLVRKFYPAVHIKVADMRPSDLKTDLGTAAFLYEDAGRARSLTGNSAPDCEGERPDTYRALCRSLGVGTVRHLLLAKARLHLRWAEAIVKTYRGKGDAQTSRLLSEMKAARAQDFLIAARVSQTLKSLEGLINTPATYVDYLNQPIPAKVGFERLDAEFADALGRADVLLGWMPRSPVYYYLSSAWRSYRDGLFWYRKVHSSRKMVVSAAAGFERGPLEELRLGAEQVGYTVVVNWRKAANYTRLAEQSLARATR